MNQPLVSVVVPIYNVEKYLDRCLTSVVNQTYKNLEIILVDDGSPDNCSVMCDEWAKKDSRIKVIHKQNEGLGMARNTGIDNSNGKYIFFFDSDDYVDFTIVEKCVCAIENKCSDVVIYGRYDVYDDGGIFGKKVDSSERYFNAESIKNKLLPAMFTYEMGFGVSAWGKMFSTDVIKTKALRFKKESEIISEDAYFTLEYFSNIAFATVIPDMLYYYCKRSGSLSHSFKKDRQERNNIFLRECLCYVEGSSLPETVGIHIKARYLLYTLDAVKQIYSADLQADEKKKEIYKIFKDPVLNSALEKEVLSLETAFVKLFFMLIKRKCFGICFILLWLRSLK